MNNHSSTGWACICYLGNSKQISWLPTVKNLIMFSQLLIGNAGTGVVGTKDVSEYTSNNKSVLIFGILWKQFCTFMCRFNYMQAIEINR